MFLSQQAFVWGSFLDSMDECTAYLAPEGLEEALESELKEIIWRSGRLFLAKGALQNVHWVQNIWFNPKTISFSSISEAAKALRQLGPLWAYFPNKKIRRGELIQAKLPFFRPKLISFPSALPTVPLGSWTLLDEKTILCSSDCGSPFVHGELHFVETKEPPSRAYLKLWEFFLKVGLHPNEGELCLELGASPGSWTWVLSQLRADVIAVDRAPLSPHIQKLQDVTFLKKDAFSIKPKDFPDVKWVFSDVICFPKKLLSWIEPWLELKVNLVCTLKFQDRDDYSVIKEFEAITGGRILRLFHHKHELVFCRLVQS